MEGFEGFTDSDGCSSDGGDAGFEGLEGGAYGLMVEAREWSEIEIEGSVSNMLARDPGAVRARGKRTEEGERRS